MKHVIIYAHPNPASFNHAILETIQNTLTQEGHEVIVRDLYAMNFNPVLSGADITGLRSGNLPDDIKTEQAYIAQADVLHFVYPTWWVGMPGILKGYIDRIFLYGFAFTYGSEGPIGLLKGKKVFLVNTGGNPQQWYTGMAETLQKTSDIGIFEFCGLEVLHHEFLAGVGTVDEDTRKGMLEQVQRLTSEAVAA